MMCLSSHGLDILTRRILGETRSEALLESKEVPCPGSGRWDTLLWEIRVDKQDFPLMELCWLCPMTALPSR